MTDEKNVQMKYLEFQMIQQQFQQLQQHVEKLDKQMVELEVLKNNLSELGDVKDGSEILAPISNGIFAKTEIKDAKNLLINVGANVVVEKSVDDSIVMIDNQIKEIRKYYKESMSQLQDTAIKAEKIREELMNVVD